MKKYLSVIFILIVFFNFSVSYANDRVSLGYIYNSSKSHIEIVENTNGNINTVSPTCFDLTLDGHLEINNIFDSEFVEEMHNQNVLVTPFLSNHWGRQRAIVALNKPEVLAEEIANAIEEHNLDGVNVDLENLLSSDKEKLTEFVRILREKIGDEKILSVAVAANPKKLTTTWVSAYDYAGLAEYANYLVLMAYDEHSAGGSAGPVASISFVEESVKVVLESVSRDKVVLGMPLYGRVWKDGAEKGGEAVVLSQVNRIANRYKNLPVYDELTGTAILKIEVQSGEKKAYVNGKYLDEGVYTIYFEDKSSILAKMEVMNNYGLKGSALWALGNESEDFWNWYEEGIANEEYESEESVNERVYYEQIEKIMENIEPIKLDYEVRLKNKIELGEFDFEIDNDLIEEVIIPQVKFKNSVSTFSKIDNVFKQPHKISKFVLTKNVAFQARSKLN